jgi:hypothetical protein
MGQRAQVQSLGDYSVPLDRNLGEDIGYDPRFPNAFGLDVRSSWLIVGITVADLWNRLASNRNRLGTGSIRVNAVASRSRALGRSTS